MMAATIFDKIIAAIIVIEFKFDTMLTLNQNNNNFSKTVLFTKDISSYIVPRLGIFINIVFG